MAEKNTNKLLSVTDNPKKPYPLLTAKHSSVQLKTCVRQRIYSTRQAYDAIVFRALLFKKTNRWTTHLAILLSMLQVCYFIGPFCFFEMLCFVNGLVFSLQLL